MLTKQVKTTRLNFNCAVNIAHYVSALLQKFEIRIQTYFSLWLSGEYGG
jgi:hypothetical protein